MWGDDLTAAVVRCSQQTIQRPPKAALDIGPWFEPSVTLLCQWILMAWQHILPEVIVTGGKKCCISSVVDGTGGDSLWNGSEGLGMLGVSVWEMKALTVKMETATLIGEGR
jgi:hypothetical protein